MSNLSQSSAEVLPPVSGPAAVVPASKGNWKPVLTLLVLSPAIGELLSGSSPPLQFFNPFFFLLLVGLYGCGALLVRETVTSRQLNVNGLLLLGAAYGIIEEGLMCKSFFNPYWTDTGFLSIYGRAWGVNWVWAFGLTFYHMAISIAAPLFLTEAMFAPRATQPWLHRRGRTVAAVVFGLVVLLGFMAFDNRQFHLVEMRQSLALAGHLARPLTPLEQFMAAQLTPKHRDVVRKAVAANNDSPELKHALQEELNRLLPRPDLYAPERFAAVALPEQIKLPTEKLPSGEKLVAFNRGLLEAAFPGLLPARAIYPFRPGWRLSLGTLIAVWTLVMAALGQTAVPQTLGRLHRPWLTGLGFTVGFIIIGFVLPSLAEHGTRVPARFVCTLWCVLAVLLAVILKRADSTSERVWRRGLWALGAITPFVLFALVLGLVVGMIGAKSFRGMPIVSFAFAIAILALAGKWKRRLEPPSTKQPAVGLQG